VLAPIKIVEFGLSHRVIDIDRSEKKGATLLHSVKTVDTSGGLLGNTVASGGNFVPLISLSRLQKSLDDAKNNFEFGVLSRTGVRESSILKEGILCLLSLVNEKSHITTIVDDDITSLALAIILRPGKGVQGALPVFFEGLSLPSENSGRFVTSNSGGGVVLGREDVARTPTDISTKSLESLDEDGRLDGHMKGSRNTGSLEWLYISIFLTASHKSRHLNLSELNVLATVVGKRNIGNYGTSLEN